MQLRLAGSLACARRAQVQCYWGRGDSGGQDSNHVTRVWFQRDRIPSVNQIANLLHFTIARGAILLKM